MISHMLPRLLGAVRTTSVPSKNIADTGSLSIGPEAIEMDMPERVPLETVLHVLGFVCYAHRALLEAQALHVGDDISCAIVWILDRGSSSQAIVIVQGMKVLFILPPSL